MTTMTVNDPGCEVSEAGRATGRVNPRLEPLEEQHLLAWRKEKKPWKWIFHQFPNGGDDLHQMD